MNELITVTGQKIKQYSKDELIVKTNMILTSVHRDLGIREEINQYDRIRFMDYVIKYFKWLTIEDIKLMFELYVIGKLDCKEHFGKWSASFYVGVIRSYVDLKNKALINQRLALPEPEITEEEIEKINSDFKNSVVKSFTRYKLDGTTNSTTFCLTVYEFWQKKGYFKGVFSISERDRVMAQIELMDEISNKPFQEVTDKQKDSRSKNLTIRRYVQELYDEWISKDVDIMHKI